MDDTPNAMNGHRNFLNLMGLFSQSVVQSHSPFSWGCRVRLHDTRDGVSSNLTLQSHSLCHVHRSLFHVHRPLFHVYCTSSVTAYRLRSAVQSHSPSQPHRSLFHVHWSLCNVHRSLFHVHRPLLHVYCT